MATIADVYRALNAMVEQEIVERYAVCGATAALFYTETLRTYDIDVFVVLEQKGLLVDISPIYNWARGRGYEVRGEHIVIHGVPVQVLDGSAGLELEAVHSAQSLDYDGVPVPVVKPEYLVLLYARAASRQRTARALDLLDLISTDEDKIGEIARQHGLQLQWKNLLEKRTNE